MSDQLTLTEAIINYIKANGAITNRECRALCGLSYDNAIRLLGSLTESGVLTRQGASSATRYVLASTAEKKPRSQSSASKPDHQQGATGPKRRSRKEPNE